MICGRGIACDDVRCHNWGGCKVGDLTPRCLASFDHYSTDQVWGSGVRSCRCYHPEVEEHAMMSGAGGGWFEGG